jgi:hypothetical protein
MVCRWGERILALNVWREERDDSNGPNGFEKKVKAERVEGRLKVTRREKGNKA